MAPNERTDHLRTLDVLCASSARIGAVLRGSSKVDNELRVRWLLGVEDLSGSDRQYRDRGDERVGGCHRSFIRPEEDLVELLPGRSPV